MFGEHDLLRNEKLTACECQDRDENLETSRFQTARAYPERGPVGKYYRGESIP